ncbi:MAG: molybdopterin-dependent oxidoreductase [Bryobacteraceae bacterium]
MRLNRREFLAVSAAANAAAANAAETKPKLLLPSDQPDEFHLRLMWYNPVPPLNQKTWRLEVKGLVDKPLQIPLAQLRALPQETQSARMKCVQCWSGRASWSGFRFPQLLELAKPRKNAKAVRIDCADKWYEYLSLDDLRNPRVLFVLDLEGKPLPDPHGAPLRLLDPSRYGYKSAKLITSITFVEEGKGSMACDIGPYYSPDGKILPGYDTPLDLGGKSKRKISGGEITDY